MHRHATCIDTDMHIHCIKTHAYTHTRRHSLSCHMHRHTHTHSIKHTYTQEMRSHTTPQLQGKEGKLPLHMQPKRFSSAAAAVMAANALKQVSDCTACFDTLFTYSAIQQQQHTMHHGLTSMPHTIWHTHTCPHMRQQMHHGLVHVTHTLTHLCTLFFSKQRGAASNKLFTSETQQMWHKDHQQTDD